jgi:NitT/TauT family transport system permease protein
MSQRILRISLPILVLALVVLCWDLAVRALEIPPFVLPSPGSVIATLISDASLLWQSLLVTLTLTFEGFLLAAVGGIALAIAFNQWRLVEYSFYPYAVILQVTPIVAIAPLLLIYLPQPLAVLACAWIVAFFPVLANTTLGLNSVDHNLLALFELYKASRWQVLWNLKLPSALPQMLAGLRIAGGLSLIGAVVAEIAAGSAGAGSVYLSHRRIRLSAQHPAHVRGAAAAVAGGRGDLLCASALSFALRRWHECGKQLSSSANRASTPSAAIATTTSIRLRQAEGQHGCNCSQRGRAQIERERIKGVPAQWACVRFDDLSEQHMQCEPDR